MASKSVIGQVYRYVRAEKKWWLVPVLVALVATALVLVVSESSVLAPFIYTLF